MGAGHQPVVGIQMRREDQRGILHRVETARDGVAQGVGALRATIVEYVVAVLVEHREMRVHAGACVILVGFGHEGGG